MTDIWVPGIDDIISLFESYRDHQILINRLSLKLTNCESRETASFSPDSIRVAQQIPALQRLIEKEEELRERIIAACRETSLEIERVHPLFCLLTNKYQQIVIRQYYLNAYNMPEVHRIMPYYSTHQWWRIRTNAFRTMAEKMAHYGTPQCDML